MGNTRDYQIAAGLFESAFEACERLSSEDQRLILRKIAKQASLHVPTAQPKEYKTVQVIGIAIKKLPSGNA
jgi:hypothetical protein